jgi:DNA-binding FrmR family transcriptional regulator
MEDYQMAKASRPQKSSEREAPADHSEDLVRLKRIRGQIEGVERMIEQGRYCLDIVNQMRSIQAAIRSAEGLMMERRIRHCVKDAIDANDSRRTEEKVRELLEIFQKKN